MDPKSRSLCDRPNVLQHQLAGHLSQVLGRALGGLVERLQRIVERQSFAWEKSCHMSSKSKAILSGYEKKPKLWHGG